MEQVDGWHRIYDTPPVRHWPLYIAWMGRDGSYNVSKGWYSPKDDRYESTYFGRLDGVAVGWRYTPEFPEEWKEKADENS